MNGITKDKVRGTFTVHKQYKNNSIRKRGFKTLNEAKAFLNNEMYLIDHPLELETKKDIILNDLYNIYIDYRSINVRITTLNGNKDKYKVHISPKFGLYSVSTLECDNIRDWKINLVKKGYSEDFTNQTIMVFKNILKFGIERDFNINKKVLSELEKVKIQKIPNERDILTFNEIDKFLATFELEDEQELMYHDYFYALSRSGMRPNEFRGLQVKDLKKDRINVNHDITSKISGVGDIIQPCKNDYSIRDVIMPLDIMDMLYNRVIGYEPNDFIFGKDTALRESNIRRQLDRHLELAKLKHITIYGFRHSLATHLIKSGVMIKVVSKRLGHKDIQTTINTYQHLLEEDQEAVIKLL